jgi:hypothetical protein
MPFWNKETWMSSNPIDVSDHCIIVVAELFAMINAQRKLLKRPPIEDRAMASRCTLRFNINRQRKVDFGGEKIVLTPDEMTALQKMVNEQFGVYFEGELTRLCAKPKVPAVKRTRVTPPPQAMAPPPVQAEKTGLVSKIKRLFSSK